MTDSVGAKGGFEDHVNLKGSKQRDRYGLRYQRVH